MIVVGVAFIVFWALVEVFRVDPTLSILMTGIVFIGLGLLFGESPWPRR